VGPVGVGGVGVVAGERGVTGGTGAMTDPRLWTEPFLLMSAPDDDPCVVSGCRTRSKTRWQVEVIGYQGHGDAPEQGPTFTACLSHLTQQMNRWLPMGGRRP